jgi:uncharacterized protein (TIGR02996 family)
VPRRPTLLPSDLDQQRAFLRSIQETPEDDAPRLIYADWLDEHDADRADFIRTQCRLEATPRNAPHWRELRTREAELLKRHKSQWLGPWDSRSNEATFRRGFLDTFRIGSNFGVGLSSLASALSPYHDLTRTFVFHSTKLAEGLVTLLGEALPCLRRLECESCFRGNVLIEGMANWPASVRLSELVLRRSEVGAVGLEDLGRAPWLGSLRSLDLRDNLFSSDALTSLLLRPALGGLEGLAISGSRHFTGRALVALLSGQLHALCRLRVQPASYPGPGLGQEGGIGDDGLRLLAESPAFARFTSLELLSESIGDRGATALADSPHARQLTTLSLRNNYLTDAGVAALAGSPFLANLTHLDLASAALTFTQHHYGDAAVRRVAESPYLQNLVTLRLYVHDLSHTATESLLDPGRLPKLRDLVLNVTRTNELVERFRARGVELTLAYHGD